MPAGARGVRAKPIGREPELVSLGEFLDREDAPGGLMLVGGPGIGKTTLWEAGVAVGSERHLRVLSTRGSTAEARLAFSGLIDFLDDVEDEVLGTLPGPQRRALEAALLRADPVGPPPELRAIALGLFNVLREWADGQSLLVAIDDLQWLDQPSMAVLAFAAPRLETYSVRYLLSRRPQRPTALERALGAGRLERLDVGPLSLGAVRQLLLDRLGLSVPRHLLRRLVDLTLGNPLFALELGRAIDEAGLPRIGEDIPLPDSIEDLLGTRVTQLREPIRTALLAAALSGELPMSQLSEIVGEETAKDALDAGVLVTDGVRVRASHPLLAAAARKRSRPRQRRALHLELAAGAGRMELRAWHLALAAEGPDDELAVTLAQAAAGASARGAAAEAVQLARHALRLTPEPGVAWAEHLLDLAGYLVVAGEPGEAAELLAPDLDSLPDGTARARACLIILEGIRTYDETRAFFARALAESERDPELHAVVLADALCTRAVVAVEGIAEAETAALEALPAARLAGPEAERNLLSALAWARSLRGRPIDDLCDRFHEASDDAFFVAGSPDRVAGQRLVWRGEVAPARAIFTRQASIAEEQGEFGSYALQRLHLCELELRVGDWEAAERLVDELAEYAEAKLLLPPMHRRCGALLAAGRGSVVEAGRSAAEAIEVADEAGIRWDRLETLRACGLVALLMGEPGRAAESLHAVWRHTEGEGVEDPGVFPVAPDLVVALVELGELGGARAVAERLQALSEAQEHPWGLASARRCDGLIESAAGGAGERSLQAAATEYARLGLGFEAGRTLLELGRTARRRKRWGTARLALQEAAAALDELGSSGWADAARAELARVPGRRPRPTGELTESERRAAELAASGLANKQIAQALFVSVHTVERHLTRAYAKLGIQSRSQLARVLAARQPAKE